MGIYTIENTTVKEYDKEPVNKENEIENFLEEHITVLDKDIFIIGRQVRTDDNKIIDLLGMDKDGNVIIIELKRGMSARAVISQALDYAVWAESMGYDELNRITKENKGYLGEHNDLNGFFKSKFGDSKVPEPWNDNQKIYIVAEQIDEKTRAMAQYLRERSVDIKCIEINFYKNNDGTGKEIVHVDSVVTGEMGEKVAQKQTWKDTLQNADDETRKLAEDLIRNVKDKLKPDVGPQSRYYYLRVPKKSQKNQFGAITCLKKSAHVSFRVDPETFKHDDKVIRGRWFFTKETERKIKLTKDNSDLVLECLKHAYDITAKLR